MLGLVTDIWNRNFLFAPAWALEKVTYCIDWLPLLNAAIWIRQISVVSYHIVVVAIGYGSLRLGRYWKRMKEEETTLVYDIVENIIGRL